jgi:hypothetical protein
LQENGCRLLETLAWPPRYKNNRGKPPARGSGKRHLRHKKYGTFIFKDLSLWHTADFFDQKNIEHVFTPKHFILPYSKYSVAKVSKPGVS